MSTYRECQNFNKYAHMKMDTRDDTAGDDCLSSSNASPPDFDFTLPCRFFKSSFARSLSLNNASNSSNHNQCKSLDYDMRVNNTKNNNSSSNKLSYTNRGMTAVLAVPPLPQKRLSQAGSFYQQNEANTKTAQKHVLADATATTNDEETPPALPARRPPSLPTSTLAQNLSVNECQINAEQKYQQTILTQLRQQTYKQTANQSNNNSVKTVVVNGKNNTCGYNSKNYIVDPTTLNQKHQHHFATSSFDKNAINNSNSCNSGSVNNMNNLRRNINNNNNDNSNNNHIVWPNQQKNVEQDCNICNYGHVHENTDGDQNATKLSTANEYNNHFHNSHQMLHMIPTINVHSNQQQQQQNQQQYHYHQQQQKQQQHQTSSYEILNDNATNVEAVILQNQVDTLQWQLKQVETSCDMYRAVVEEVARFLERYQSQKQLQQQQLQQQKQHHQQQQQQQQHHHHQQMSTQKHFNNNNKLEQIPRSKSLFQVYIAGGHEKNKNENNNSLDDTSPTDSYLRARSSTNLIDLKHQQLNASCDSKSKDDHIYETCLAPSQSYSAFKDFTWRRSPKKSDSRLNIAKDDAEEKLNQEAFRLLRTIQNLLNTSQHQPNLSHHRQAASQVGVLSQAMSTTSVLTLPGPPILNSANAINNGSSTPDSTNTSPTTTTVNTAAAAAAAETAADVTSTNLAPEMLFLRSANMRDSRLSLRSSTDSSVHSTSSAASSASSKVETDEEASTPFHSPPNLLTHKQHHHLTGSSTEDESGFSSISSFPDIGVPLSSTPLPSANISSRNRFIGKEVKSLKSLEKDLLQATDSGNSTLKANVVGLPLNSSQEMSHRWDSPSKTYHNASNKFQKFSALTNEDSNTVLWV